MHILIIGCGYVGVRAAQLWRGRGLTVTALTRSDARAAEFFRMGIHAVCGDVLNLGSLRNLPAADICLYAVGYDRAVAADKEEVYVAGLSNVLNEIGERVPRLIYLSSSSVYGQDGGEVVNELSICEPTTKGGRICLAAESVVREFFSSKDATILRLSGIYGPGRLIGRKQQLQSHTPIPGNPQGWLNLIHVADIVQAIDGLVHTTRAEVLYLLSDGHPMRRIEFYSELARNWQLPAPVMTESVSGPLGKRCDPSRVLNELQLKLRYPSAVDGLADSI